jgi:hypothetical protein
MASFPIFSLHHDGKADFQESRPVSVLTVWTVVFITMELHMNPEFPLMSCLDWLCKNKTGMTCAGAGPLSSI